LSLIGDEQGKCTTRPGLRGLPPLPEATHHRDYGRRWLPCSYLHRRNRNGPWAEPTMRGGDRWLERLVSAKLVSAMLRRDMEPTNEPDITTRVNRKNRPRGCALGAGAAVDSVPPSASWAALGMVDFANREPSLALHGRPVAAGRHTLQSERQASHGQKHPGWPRFPARRAGARFRGKPGEAGEARTRFPYSAEVKAEPVVNGDGPASAFYSLGWKPLCPTTRRISGRRK
jgi:hypothetical protein